MTPKKKARKAVKAKIRDIIGRGGATPMPELVKQVDAAETAAKVECGMAAME